MRNTGERVCGVADSRQRRMRGRDVSGAVLTRLGGDRRWRTACANCDTRTGHADCCEHGRTEKFLGHHRSLQPKADSRSKLRQPRRTSNSFNHTADYAVTFVSAHSVQRLLGPCDRCNCPPLITKSQAANGSTGAQESHCAYKGQFCQPNGYQEGHSVHADIGSNSDSQDHADEESYRHQNGAESLQDSSLPDCERSLERLPDAIAPFYSSRPGRCRSVEVWQNFAGVVWLLRPPA